MILKLFNGPLHGLEIDSRAALPFVDFLDRATGKVRRYTLTNTAFFSQEWDSIGAYKEENSGVQLVLPLEEEEAVEIAS